MGNSYFNAHPNQVYKKYLSNLNFLQLKEQWTTIEHYRIKKIFESFCKKAHDEDKHVILYESLKQIFTEFYRYKENQIQRIYKIFDFDEKKCIDWNNFYTFITICNKAPVSTLALLMFMIFDENLSKQLKRDQLKLLIDLNINYIQEYPVDREAHTIVPDEIGKILIPQNQEFISIVKWLEEAPKIFDFEEYRKFFNIFNEIKLQKELIQNFESWNQIFDQTENKYISYLIDFKWFELWKTYALVQYGVSINSLLKSPNNTFKTVKQFKTKKTLKTNKSIKSEKNILTKTLINPSCEDNTIKNIDQKCNSKNYNLIHSHIGSRPEKIFNRELEGQYLEVLTPQLVQNMNYTLVSQKVWKKLKLLYQAYPEFLRTGNNTIELYPKRVKVYSALFKERLDYSSEIIREVPCFTTIEDLFKIYLSIENLNSKIVFFKTVGMNKWEELTALNFMFTELTSEILIFNVHDSFFFRKNHCKVAQSISEVNLGDQIRYDHCQKSKLKKAFYMGQTQNGREIVHFKGSSHIYDEHIKRQKFLQKASLIHRNVNPPDSIKILSLDIPIIPILKSYDFINCLIIMLISNPDIKSILGQLPSNNQNKQILDILANIYKQSKKKIRVDNSVITRMMEEHLSDFVRFQFGMIDDCFRTFMEILDKNLKRIKIRNIIRQSYYFTTTKKIKCTNCSKLNVSKEKCYSLKIELTQNDQKYFEFSFVPFSATLTSLDLKKYGLKMKSTSTFKLYKEEIKKLIEFENQPFVICQIYGNDIIRNFSFVKDETTLQELNLKQTDIIVVYELCVELDRFIVDHYTQVKDITHKKFRKGDLIDCKVGQDKWMAGKILDIEFMPYTQKTMIKVSHEQNHDHQTKKEYQLHSDLMAIFPTKSYLFDNQYHLKVIQRCYNEALNEMIPSNIPLVMVLTDWMRCKQFQFMVYQQLKIFIAENYRFKDVEYGHDDDFYGNNHKFLSSKHFKKEKIKRFRQYLTSQNFPYSISLLDLNGRCLLCHKIHKTKIVIGESEYFCSGCKLDTQNPITWQVKVFNCMVCIDWHGFDRFRKNNIKDHISFTEMIMNKNNDIQKLDKLIEEKLTKKVLEIQQQCCKFPYKTALSEELKSFPSVLIIQIQRLMDNGINPKTINRKHLSFPMDELKVSHKTYFLQEVISIEGTSQIIYKNYVCNESQEWFQVYGETIKKVKRNIVKKCCALFLIYKMKITSENQQKLPSYRESSQFFNTEKALNKIQSPKSLRNKIRRLTINQRLLNADSDNQNFSYLNTEKQDKVFIERKQSSDFDSDIPPPRSNSKRSIKYVKNSKELIKSANRVRISSQEERDRSRMIRLNKMNKKINNLKDTNSCYSFSGDQKKKQKIVLNSPNEQKQTQKLTNLEASPKNQQNLIEWRRQFTFEDKFQFEKISSEYKEKSDKEQNQNNLKVSVEKRVK